jgi:hypothetical protein
VVDHHLGLAGGRRSATCDRTAASSSLAPPTAGPKSPPTRGSPLPCCSRSGPRPGAARPIFATRPGRDPRLPTSVRDVGGDRDAPRCRPILWRPGPRLQGTVHYEDTAFCLLPRARGPEIVGEWQPFDPLPSIHRVLCGAAVDNDLIVSVRTDRGRRRGPLGTGHLAGRRAAEMPSRRGRSGRRAEDRRGP